MENMNHHGMHMPDEAEPPHNMMVVGQKGVYLSHLPMFMSPHNFQVILEAELTQGGKSVQDIYVRDRQNNPNVKMYTLEPQDAFKLPSLFTPTPPARASFRAKLMRGHLERGGTEVSGLTRLEVKIKRVIYAEELDGTRTKPDKLTYILFGRPDELFMAHLIAAPPPDFDQIISVKVGGHKLTEQELKGGVEVVFTERPNTVAGRFREKERSKARGHVTGAHQFLNLEVEGLTEFYFEEGELISEEGSFRTTREEKKAGF
ncbi:MAG TPA: hypothetical protein VF735_14500 [Pyrinomonadaceae bacterium]|jgi:hypothetical protein